MKSKIAVTVDKEVLGEMDRLRGMATRSAFVNHILKLGLKAFKETQPNRRESACPKETR